MGWFKKREKKPTPPPSLPPKAKDVITMYERGIIVDGLAYGGDHQGWQRRKVYFPDIPALEERGPYVTMCRSGSQKAIAPCSIESIVRLLNSRE